MNKLNEQIKKKPAGKIRIICNSSAVDAAREFMKLYPDMEIKHGSNISANIFLRSDGRIFVSSEGLGKTNTVGVSVGVKSKYAYDRYIEDVFEVQWGKSAAV